MHPAHSQYGMQSSNLGGRSPRYSHMAPPHFHHTPAKFTLSHGGCSPGTWLKRYGGAQVIVTKATSIREELWRYSHQLTSDAVVCNLKKPLGQFHSRHRLPLEEGRRLPLGEATSPAVQGSHIASFPGSHVTTSDSQHQTSGESSRKPMRTETLNDTACEGDRCVALISVGPDRLPRRSTPPPRHHLRIRDPAYHSHRRYARHPPIARASMNPLALQRSHTSITKDST